MKYAFLIAAAAGTALAGCNARTTAQQGLSPVHIPVVASTNFVFDAPAYGGALGPQETARLDGWFAGLGLDFGDRIYVSSSPSPLATAQVAEVAGRYGILLSDGAPVAAGAASSNVVRVVVNRATASVPGCPDWSQASNPNFQNNTMSNYGCSVNANLAVQVASPQDLVSGAKTASTVDAEAARKAIQMYRDWPLTGILEGQTKRPLQNVKTKSGD